METVTSRRKQALVRRARRKPQARPDWLTNADVGDREAVIAEYVTGGDVLDLGVIDSRRAEEATAQKLADGSTLLHEHIRRINPNVMGVDIDAEGIAILQARGYNVLCADVHSMDLGDNSTRSWPGRSSSISQSGASVGESPHHLTPTGRLILTTCNPFCILEFLKILQFNDIQVHEEHTVWFDPRTLARLLEMSGYWVERLCWLRQHRRHGRFKLWPARWRTYFHANFLLVARPAE